MCSKEQRSKEGEEAKLRLKKAQNAAKFNVAEEVGGGGGVSRASARRGGICDARKATRWRGAGRRQRQRWRPPPNRLRRPRRCAVEMADALKIEFAEVAEAVAEAAAALEETADAAGAVAREQAVRPPRRSLPTKRKRRWSLEKSTKRRRSLQRLERLRGSMRRWRLRKRVVRQRHGG